MSLGLHVYQNSEIMLIVTRHKALQYVNTKVLYSYIRDIVSLVIYFPKPIILCIHVIEFDMPGLGRIIKVNNFTTSFPERSFDTQE